jgi:hypothetical protein
MARMVRTDKTRVQLQVRSTRLAPAKGDGPSVWLVGAVHVGEKAYYRQLQGILDAQDLVLYEGVGRIQPAAPTTGTTTTAPPKSTYRLFADAIGLSDQTSEIRYDRPHFRNADLTWKQVQTLAAKEGKKTQGAITGIGRLLDPNSPQRKEIAFLFQTIQADPGLAEAMRVLMVRVLANPKMLADKAPSLGSGVVIDARNQRVLSHFDAAQRAQPGRSIAIFYGAGHLPGLQKGLESRGYRPVETRWITALAADEKKVSPEGKMLLGALGG